MACCCKSCCPPNKSAVSCLGRCDLPKHQCLDREDVKPGPVPKNMGWLYTAKDSPGHQLRCGWRPGHISCAVLRKIERHNCMKASCGNCTDVCLAKTPCSPRPCSAPCPRPCGAPCPPPSCGGPCPPSSCGNPCGPLSDQPLIRIMRHNGEYTITTKPSNIDNSPSGPYPLKYFLDTDDSDLTTTVIKYSVEAKYNDNQFDYTSSQSSFVIDFTPPPMSPCVKKSYCCL